MLQGIPFTVDLFVLAIEGPDVVLGFPWLQLLGRVPHDYSALMMEFWWQCHKVTMIGETTNLATPISLHQLQALLSGGDSPQLFELSPLLLPKRSTLMTWNSSLTFPLLWLTYCVNIRVSFRPQPTFLPIEQLIIESIWLRALSQSMCSNIGIPIIKRQKWKS